MFIRKITLGLKVDLVCTALYLFTINILKRYHIIQMIYTHTQAQDVISIISLFKPLRVLEIKITHNCY